MSQSGFFIFEMIFCEKNPFSNVNDMSKQPGNRGLWILLGLLTIFALTLFFIPAFVIRPFTHQSERGLRLAIAVKRIAPVFTLAVLAGVLALAWRLWRNSSNWLRAGIVVAMLLTVVSTVMVRQNYFEWMFNPIKAAGFIPASDAKLSDTEMVMAVRIGDEARAYPIVQMAYHHILNETVANVPIVVTY
jgi:Protein of unknown function (DUF3179)